MDKLVRLDELLRRVNNELTNGFAIYIKKSYSAPRVYVGKHGVESVVFTGEIDTLLENFELMYKRIPWWDITSEQIMEMVPSLLVPESELKDLLNSAQSDVKRLLEQAEEYRKL